MCAQTLGLRPLASPGPVSPARDLPGAADFAEQFSLDVTGIGEASRAALSAELGAGAREFAMAVYAADWLPRARWALDALFAPDPAGWASAPAVAVPGLWPAVEEFLAAVARLQGLDPVTTELVRLRGARQHNCRRCQSLRSVTALDAGADEALFGAVDAYADSALPARQKAALALTDALIWQPAHIPDDVLGAVRERFAPAEAVELVLDIARNASNKIAVAMGADEPAVREGTQPYEVRPDGSIDYDARPRGGS